MQFNIFYFILYLAEIWAIWARCRTEPVGLILEPEDQSISKHPTERLEPLRCSNISRVSWMSYYIFVPETCIVYLSESCSFLNCSVSTTVWRGGDCVPPFHILSCWFYTVCLLHKSSARWHSWQINMKEYGKGDGTEPLVQKSSARWRSISYLILS